MQMLAVALAVLLLNPVRLYFQPNQPILVSLDAAALAALPDELKQGELGLALLTPAGQVQQTVAIDASQATIDLMALFPAQGRGKSILWNGKTWYLQLTRGGKPIGSPLVVVPLRPPGRGAMEPNALRIYPEKLVLLDTTTGPIAIRLDPEAAPNTTLHFSQLVEGGFYTNVIFHRIIPQFVVQGGDPTGTGTGGPGYFLDLESSAKPHTRGTISMARQGHDVNTSGSQFFICLSRQAVAQLDRQYTAFGDVVSGMDAVDRMVALPTSSDGANRPLNPPMIRQARLIPAPPRPLGSPAPPQVIPPVEAGQGASGQSAAPANQTEESARQEARQLGQEALQLLGEKK